MKTYKYLSIISVALFIGIIGYTIGLNKRINKQIDHFKMERNTITKQETDERGLISVQYIKDGEEWGLDYLTRHEYDSLFHDYVNYKKTETDNWVKLGGKPIRIIN
jgi:hypothetical protein